MSTRVLNDQMQVFDKITTAFGVHFPGYTVSLIEWEGVYIGQVHLLDKHGDIHNATVKLSKKEWENNQIDKALILGARVEESARKLIREIGKLSDCTPVSYKLAKALSDGKTPQRTR